MQRTHVSQRLALPIKRHSDIDFVDVAVNDDTQLFVDACLIEICKDTFSLHCQQVIQDYFECLCQTFKESRYNLDILYHLGERNEARLGYGSGTNGKAKTPEGMSDTLSDLHVLIASGIPLDGLIDIPVMMPRFAEDCMSDMLINILYKPFSEFTLAQCEKYGIPSEHAKTPRHYWDEATHTWKVYEGESLIIDGKVILLIPKRYVTPRFLYSTSHFFMSKIAIILQKERTYVLSGKRVVPSKAEIRKGECQTFGSMVNATRHHTQKIPNLLFDYHQRLKVEYQDRAMSDKELDKQVYGLLDEETVA